MFYIGECWIKSSFSNWQYPQGNQHINPLEFSYKTTSESVLELLGATKQIASSEGIELERKKLNVKREKNYNTIEFVKVNLQIGFVFLPREDVRGIEIGTKNLKMFAISFTKKCSTHRLCGRKALAQGRNGKPSILLNQYCFLSMQPT